MRKISIAMVLGILFASNHLKVSAQDAQIVNASAIEPYRIGVSSVKTSNLIFPYAIKSVDRGSSDIIVQKAIGVENVLQVKAAKTDFPETNLTVVTADGNLYSYVVTYLEHPVELSLRFDNSRSVAAKVAVFKEDATTDAVANQSKAILGKLPVIPRVSEDRYDISVAITGVYIHDDMLYFQASMTNRSSIPYDIGQFRFSIRDRKKSKRTSSQELELTPVHITGATAKLGGWSVEKVVIAIPKFTIPDKKFLLLQLMEQQGGRTVELKIPNKVLMGARQAAL